MRKQAERVYKYIKDFGSISQLDATFDLGITRLAAVIFDMKKEGIQFCDKTESRKNRYGENTSYKRYYLAEDVLSAKNTVEKTETA